MRIETVCVYMYYLLLFGLLDVVDTFESSLLEHRVDDVREDGVGGEMDAHNAMRVDVIVIVERTSSRYGSRRGGEQRRVRHEDATPTTTTTTTTTGGGPVFREDGGRGKEDGGERGATVVIQGERR